MTEEQSIQEEGWIELRRAPGVCCPDRREYKRMYHQTHREQEKEYEKHYKDRRNRNRRELRYARGINRPASEAKDCANYLGVYIAERVLSKFFDRIERMPVNNPGYDFICGKGFKIDAKSACIHHASKWKVPRWCFHIYRNVIADYFLCLAFDDRESLEPQHVWLIPGKIVNHLSGFAIPSSEYGIEKWKQYERSLEPVFKCCEKVRSEA